MGKGENEKKGNEKNEDSKTVILKVYMHCQACAMKTERTLKGYEGVELVITDLKNNNVTVKGKVDPQKLCKLVQKKLGKKNTELVYSGDEKKTDQKSSDDKRTDENKQQENTSEKKTTVAIVVMKVQMHCEACAIALKKTILKMKGVESAEVDFKNQKCTVRGTMDSKDLVDYIHKKARRRAQIIPQMKLEEGQTKGDSKDDNVQEKKGDGDGDGDGSNIDENISDIPKYVMQNCYPPQLFSEENPNACSVM